MPFHFDSSQLPFPSIGNGHRLKENFETPTTAKPWPKPPTVNQFENSLNQGRDLPNQSQARPVEQSAMYLSKGFRFRLRRIEVNRVVQELIHSSKQNDYQSIKGNAFVQNWPHSNGLS